MLQSYWEGPCRQKNRSNHDQSLLESYFTDYSELFALDRKVLQSLSRGARALFPISLAPHVTSAFMVHTDETAWALTWRWSWLLI